MASDWYLKTSSNWKLVNNAFVKVSGSWKEIQEGYIKVSGAWKQFYQAFVATGFSTATANTTIVVPDGANAIHVQAAVGGGSGGVKGAEYDKAGGESAGAGGASGGFVSDQVYSVTQGETLTLTVGAGGAASTGSSYNTTAGSGGGGSSDQVTREVTLGETVLAGDVLRLATSNDAPITPGSGVKALATNGDNVDAIGIADASGNAGDSISMILFGVRDLSFSIAPTTAQIGKDVFLDATTSGAVTLTAPNISGTSIIKIGKVLDADGLTTTQPCKIDIEFVAELS